MLAGDEAAGAAGAAAEAFPGAACRGRAAHFRRNALSKAPRPGRPKAAAAPKAIRATGPREASGGRAPEAAAGPGAPGLGEAAKAVRGGRAETLACARFPRERWRRIRANNAIGRLDRGIRCRTRAVGAFPDGRGALMPVAARLRRVAEGEWGPGRRLDATLPDGWPHRGGPMGCLKVRKNLDGAGLNAAH